MFIIKSWFPSMFWKSWFFRIFLKITSLFWRGVCAWSQERHSYLSWEIKERKAWLKNFGNTVESTRKKWLRYGNKIRDNKRILCCFNQNFAAATKRFVDRTNHFVVVTKYFFYPYFNKWFCWCNKTFYTVNLSVIKAIFGGLLNANTGSFERAAHSEWQCVLFRVKLWIG